MNIAIKLTLPALLLVGTAILGWPGGQALAQGTSAGALEEITVTARRREESLIDTPVSITATVIAAEPVVTVHASGASISASSVPPVWASLCIPHRLEKLLSFGSTFARTI